MKIINSTLLLCAISFIALISGGCTLSTTPVCSGNFTAAGIAQGQADCASQAQTQATCEAVTINNAAGATSQACTFTATAHCNVDATAENTVCGGNVDQTSCEAQAPFCAWDANLLTCLGAKTLSDATCGALSNFVPTCTVNTAAEAALCATLTGTGSPGDAVACENTNNGKFCRWNSSSAACISMESAQAVCAARNNTDSISCLVGNFCEWETVGTGICSAINATADNTTCSALSGGVALCAGGATVNSLPGVCTPTGVQNYNPANCTGVTAENGQACEWTAAPLSASALFTGSIANASTGFCRAGLGNDGFACAAPISSHVEDPTAACLNVTLGTTSMCTPVNDCSYAGQLSVGLACDALNATECMATGPTQMNQDFCALL